MRSIAIYGKGGIGKSTISSNLSAALASLGYKVMQIGCDPKQDSTFCLTHNVPIMSVLELLAEKGESNIGIDDIVYKGWNNIICIEAGGPAAGIGCAGRGIISSIELIRKLNIFNKFQIDFVIFDVLGDVVCGGFAMPLREGYAQEVYIVTSGESMSLYAANNICHAIKRFGERGASRLGGLICNSRNIENEEDRVNKLAEKISTNVIEVIPRSENIQMAESNGMTTIQYNEKSNISNQFRNLAKKIINNKDLVIPTPLAHLDVRKMFFYMQKNY